MTWPDDDTPACWSWDVPPLRDYDAEIDAIVAARANLSRGAVELIFRGGPDQMRWLEFHTGVRPSEAFHTEPRCAICDGSWGRIVDDHDHFTGLLRGMLCRGCNISEGLGARDVGWAYGERNPATILEHRRYYVGYGWRLGWWKDPAYARRLTGNPDWMPLEER